LSAAPESTSLLGGDLEVGRFGFGAMRITGPGIWGPPAPPAPPEGPAGARALLRHVVDAGVNLIDTADSYGPEVSENLIAEALHPYPDGLVIATKGGLTRSGPDRWGRNCRPDRLKRCCEDSLRRLRLERIDLYQLHAVDPQVPVEDSIGALTELQQEGKIRHIGVSNVSEEELERAQQIATVVSVQNRYNLADRSAEEVLRACEEQRLAFLPWAPLSSGRLVEGGGVVDEIARAHQATPAQLAIAWLLQRSPAMLPIPGTSSIAHFDALLDATRLELEGPEIEALDGLSS
jgi:aryl-alcohol dehydrogenase-like predicted oxidoreductase